MATTGPLPPAASSSTTPETSSPSVIFTMGLADRGDGATYFQRQCSDLLSEQSAAKKEAKLAGLIRDTSALATCTTRAMAKLNQSHVFNRDFKVRGCRGGRGGSTWDGAGVCEKGVPLSPFGGRDAGLVQACCPLPPSAAHSTWLTRDDPASCLLTPLPSPSPPPSSWQTPSSPPASTLRCV